MASASVRLAIVIFGGFQSSKICSIVSRSPLKTFTLIKWGIGFGSATGGLDVRIQDFIVYDVARKMFIAVLYAIPIPAATVLKLHETYRPCFGRHTIDTFVSIWCFSDVSKQVEYASNDLFYASISAS